MGEATLERRPGKVYNDDANGALFWAEDEESARTLARTQMAEDPFSVEPEISELAPELVETYGNMGINALSALDRENGVEEYVDILTGEVVPTWGDGDGDPFGFLL